MLNRAADADALRGARQRAGRASQDGNAGEQSKRIDRMGNLAIGYRRIRGEGCSEAAGEVGDRGSSSGSSGATEKEEGSETRGDAVDRKRNAKHPAKVLTLAADVPPDHSGETSSAPLPVHRAGPADPRATRADPRARLRSRSGP